MDYPFNTDETAYAYISAKASSAGGDRYAHLNLTMRLPALRDTYEMRSVCLCVTSQATKQDWQSKEKESFYAVRLTADGSDMTLENMERATKALKALHKAIDKLNEAAGAPASMLDEYLMRVLMAAKVTHVYAPERTSSGDSGWIANMPLYHKHEFGRLHDQLRYLRRELLTFVNPEPVTA